MIFTRSLLYAVTTLTRKNRTSFEPPPANATVDAQQLVCSNPALEDVCSATNPLILPEHVMLPLLLPCAALLFSHMPTILLASRARVRDLKNATTNVVLAWLGVSAVGWAYASGFRAFAYAVSLHTSVYLLSQPASPTAVVGPLADLFARETCITLVLLCAMQLGPPLPVAHAMGHPTAAVCCGVASHLAGSMIPDLVGPIAADLARRLVAYGV